MSSIMNDQGTHFVNETIEELLQHFLVIHHKSTPYCPQAKGIAEAFNKVLECILMKICNGGTSDWDLKIPVVLCAHRTTYMIFTKYCPFLLVYGLDAAY